MCSCLGAKWGSRWGLGVGSGLRFSTGLSILNGLIISLLVELFFSRTKNLRKSKLRVSFVVPLGGSYKNTRAWGSVTSNFLPPGDDLILTTADG